MNIKTLNAHLKLLGPAPKGFKWKKTRPNETIQRGKCIVDGKVMRTTDWLVGQTVGPAPIGDNGWWYLAPTR